MALSFLAGLIGRRKSATTPSATTARRRAPKRDDAERRRREAERIARRMENASADRLGGSVEEYEAWAREQDSHMEHDRHDTDSLIRECRDCGEPFEIAAGEQTFYRAKGLFLPKRCPACRAYRRQEREQAVKHDAA